ncbi:MAG: hypothetical protein WCO42_10025 [bacterium]
MTPKGKRIHLIEKDHKNRLTKVGDGLWESGHWNILESTAKKLLEGSILLHEKPRAASFFGGIILNYRLQDRGRLTGLVIFTFKYDAGHRGVMAEGKGWSREMKIVMKA